jgi:hypothetical protein
MEIFYNIHLEYESCSLIPFWVSFGINSIILKTSTPLQKKSQGISRLRP